MSGEKEEEESVRIDVWLWAVRLYKTRGEAAEACRSSHVRIAGEKVKPSRKVRPGQRIVVSRGFLERDVEVAAVLSKRVGAKLVSTYLIDHTSEEAREKAAALARANRAGPRREEGSGRPTKRDRRDLDQLMTDSAEEAAAFERFARTLADHDGD